MKRWMVWVSAGTFAGCLSGTPPPELADAYRAAGKNKGELEKAIQHFSEDPRDSLKRRAAVFMIRNLEGLYYLAGEQLDQYLHYLELVNRDQLQGEHIMQAFQRKFGHFSLHNARVHYDLQEITSAGIIMNVDMAFRVWKEQPWGKHITFEQFCEYILPFRIPGAKPENNREAIYRKFNPLLDSVRQAGGDVLAACAVINNQLRRDGWLFTTRPGFLPHFPASVLMEHRTGSCRDMTDLAIYVMRAVGIPVSVDVVQQWAYKSNGHMWNTVLDKNGDHHMFMCVDQNPGTTHKPGSKKGKVFRRSYAIQPHSLALQKSGEEKIPGFFMDPRLLDVTEQYSEAVEVPVVAERPVKGDRHVYLAVFDDHRWVPIHWAAVTEGSDTVLFSRMEPDVAYLPVTYHAPNYNEAFAYPVVPDRHGHTRVLKPDTSRMHQEMKLHRVFPVIPDHFTVGNLKGGRFQVANRPDFSDGRDVHEVQDPMPYWNRVTLDDAGTYRYVRYIPAPGKRCAMGEMAFFSAGNRLSGKIIGKTEPNTGAQPAAHAFDGNMETTFLSKYAAGSWIGLDLGTPRRLDSIRYAAPVNVRPKQKIVSGQSYELFYWAGSRGWKSVGKKEGVDNRVVFHNVPSNALYLLDNVHEKGEKRIFTYEHGQQRWW